MKNRVRYAVVQVMFITVARSREAISQMVKYPFTHIIFGLILLASVAFNAFCIANYWQIKPNWAFCPVEPNEDRVSEVQEAFFGKVVGFYETLIYYQFGIIGILLVVCFIYTNVLSRRQAREIIDEEIYSDHFNKFFSEKIQRLGERTLTTLLDNDDIRERVRTIEEQLANIKKPQIRKTTTIRQKTTKKPPKK